MIGMGMIKMILRVTALLWTVLITALIGNIIASNIDAASSATAAVNFAMFVTVLAWLACIIGILAFFASVFAKPVVQLPFDGLTVLFSFIAAIVLAAKLRAVNCGNISSDSLPNDWIAWGSNNDEKRCREIQASTVFMWFLFACTSGSLFFTVKDARSNYGGSLPSSRPSMSQVGV
ncbi:Fc.00g100570.m01.CDS01 [Cosmosporella sp. VM-42]